MEKLCGALGRSILLSAPVAASCGRETVSLGLHRLRGVTTERELFGLAEERAPSRQRRMPRTGFMG